MALPERFSNLPEHVFPRLRRLLAAHAPGAEPLSLSIGEPRHPFPDWVGDVIAENLAEFGRYPPNFGTDELIEAMAGWFGRRFGLALEASQLMVLNGSREGIFSAALALCAEAKAGRAPCILFPNPFYQAYAAGAAAIAAEPVYVAATQTNGFLPDYQSVDADILNRTVAAFICSPSNPEGAVADTGYLKALIGLAERHDFQIFADECYSEIYEGAAPVSALAVAAEMGADPERVVVFNSLSKRSNLPGLRVGLVAGGPKTIAAMRLLREYGGAPVPLPLQRVAERLWSDETHVAANRALYVEKYAIARKVLGDVQGIVLPSAGFFLWLAVQDGEAATVKLWKQSGIRVLPGAYLARESGGKNPGKGYIRAAMVAPNDEMHRGLSKLRDCLYN